MSPMMKALLAQLEALKTMAAAVENSATDDAESDFGMAVRKGIEELIENLE